MPKNTEQAFWRGFCKEAQSTYEGRRLLEQLGPLVQREHQKEVTEAVLNNRKTDPDTGVKRQSILMDNVDQTAARNKVYEKFPETIQELKDKATWGSVAKRGLGGAGLGSILGGVATMNPLGSLAGAGVGGTLAGLASMKRRSAIHAGANQVKPEDIEAMKAYYQKRNGKSFHPITSAYHAYKADPGEGAEH